MRRHPGAAVLAGKFAAAKSVGFVPALSQAKSNFDGPEITCQVSQSSSDVRVCHAGVQTHPKHTVAVVGDSVAGQWLPALQQIAQARRWRLEIITHSRCPFSATMMVNLGSSAPYVACQRWGEAALQTVLRMHPDALVTAERPVLGTPDADSKSPAANQAIAAGMAQYWRTLLAHGIAVVPIRESPEMGQDQVDCLHKSNGDPHPCMVKRSTALPKNPPEVIAAHEVDRAALINMSDLLCAPKRCSPIVGNVLVYRDPHHVTATYIRTTTPYLDAKIQRQVPALR